MVFSYKVRESLVRGLQIKLTSEKHQTPNHIETVNFVIFPNCEWFGNMLVRNFVGRIKLQVL